MLTCVHAYVHAHIHAHVNAHVCAYVHAHMHACVHAYVHAYVHTHMHAQLRYLKLEERHTALITKPQATLGEWRDNLLPSPTLHPSKSYLAGDSSPSIFNGLPLKQFIKSKLIFLN